MYGSQKNLKLAEIPTNLLNPKIKRKPHLRPFRDGIRHIMVILKIKFKEDNL